MGKFSIKSYSNLTINEFKGLLRESNKSNVRLIANFLRLPLFFSDCKLHMRVFKLFGGHFSPIGGYLENEEMVLVHDVNKKFGSWFVPTERFFESCNTIDVLNNTYRGIIKLTILDQ